MGLMRPTMAKSTLGTRIDGGDAIYAEGGGRCSLGFNVSIGSESHFLTAGRCGNIASTWYPDSGQSNVLGSTVGSSFPGNDYTIIRHTGSASTPSSVNLYNGSSQSITSAGDGYVGESVQRSRSTTGVHGGQVTAQRDGELRRRQRFRFAPDHSLPEPGDSGGSLFDGSTAVGLTSGGNGTCSSGGTTYFQPVTEALDAFGATI